ncbi:hypothetical protein HGRIS_008606 [Hohenbuehelia grisea]|uniref:Uncharacterized protein n=1 Tax=Hohenbuehelia grisea TaxID=104357 RepID=A0ABR3J9Y8_9AGAR
MRGDIYKVVAQADALRRHQKSRHNGVVIEPPSAPDKTDEREDEAIVPSPSNSRSSSTSPPSKGKDRAVSYAPATTQVQPPMRSSTSNGPTSYYRSHTSGGIIPYTQRINPSPLHPYGQVELPTSATRLNQATWGPSQARSEEPPQMSAINYHQVHGSYYTSSHYRLNGYSSQASNSRAPRSRSRTPSDSRSSRTTSPAPILRPEHNGLTDRRPTSPSPSPSSPVVDPSLDHSNGPPRIGSRYQTSSFHDDDLRMAPSRSVVEVPRCSEHQATARYPLRHDLRFMDAHSSDNRMDIDGSSDNRRDDRMHLRRDNTPPAYASSSYKRPEPMEPMLTEDGEPMLNPAELLTQESLASPPPS